MTNAQHTPGPWSNDGGNVRSDATDQGIALVGTTWGDNRVPHETNMANARLIAAAPDMLEALQAALRQLDAYAELLPKDDPEVIRASEMVWNAIKKATGSR